MKKKKNSTQHIVYFNVPTFENVNAVDKFRKL